MQSWLIGSLNAIIKAFGVSLTALISLLPNSPFAVDGSIMSRIDPDTIAYINWIIPTALIFTTLIAWVAAIAIWYAIRIGLRWIKAASD